MEITGLRTQLNETEIEHGRAISAVEAQRDAGTAREAEKSEELRKVRQAAERAACSGEDEVIAAEKVIRASHEGEVSSLQERACKAEERVRGHGSCGNVEQGFGGGWDGFDQYACPPPPLNLLLGHPSVVKIWPHRT